MPAGRVTIRRSSTARRTKGITPPKSNWALPIDEPPFHGYAVTCGITFSFGGLKITTDGEVEDTTGRVIPGLFAGGELVGGVFYQNYLGGAGLMSGSVFGRIAGRIGRAVRESAQARAALPRRSALHGRVYRCSGLAR